MRIFFSHFEPSMKYIHNLLCNPVYEKLNLLMLDFIGNTFFYIGMIPKFMSYFVHARFLSIGKVYVNFIIFNAI